MSKGWLDELPWATGDMRREHRVDASKKKQSSLWQSAPNLAFDETTEEQDNFTTFDEPDFCKSLANLDYPFNLSDDDDATGDGFDCGKSCETDAATSPRVKVRASQLSNMSIKGEEIKDLFSQWKQKSKLDSFENSSKTKEGLSPISPGGKLFASSPQKSPAKKMLIKKKSKNPKPACPSPSAEGEAHPNSPTKRKKKVAVKLKARDLNLSKSKQEEIEQMFWKWKESEKDATTANQQSNDRRWSDETRPYSASRPKIATRQLSFDGEPVAQSNGGIQPLRVSSRERAHPARSRTRSSESLEQSSDDRERRSSSRGPRVRRDRSKSRSGSKQRSTRDRSKSRDNRRSKSQDGKERRARSKSRSTSREYNSRSSSEEFDPRSSSGEFSRMLKDEFQGFETSPTETETSVEPRKRSKSTSRRPGYIRRIDSTEGESKIRSGRKRSPSVDRDQFAPPNDAGIEFTGHDSSTFPL